MHIAEAKRTLGSRITWLCDTMDNDLKHALGDRPNSEFILDPEGKIIEARQWSNPALLREDLVRLVGKVAKPTLVRNLNLKQLPPPEKAVTGVVKRVAMSGAMQPAKVEAIESPGDPLYAKLRAEFGGGKLYLGFFLDPLYKVHWNNEAPVLKYSIETPRGVTLSRSSGEGPKVAVKADADPREFLVDFSGRSSEPLRISVSYFACDDAETFCRLVKQEYLVTLERDPDGGNRRGLSRFGGRGRNSGPRRGDQNRNMRRPRFP